MFSSTQPRTNVPQRVRKYNDERGLDKRTIESMVNSYLGRPLHTGTNRVTFVQNIHVTYEADLVEIVWGGINMTFAGAMFNGLRLKSKTRIHFILSNLPDIYMVQTKKGELENSIILDPIFAIVSDVEILNSFMAFILPSGYEMTLYCAVQLAYLLCYTVDPFTRENVERMRNMGNTFSDMVKAFGLEGNVPKPLESLVLFTVLTNKQVDRIFGQNWGYVPPETIHKHPLGIMFAARVCYSILLEEIGEFAMRLDFGDMNPYLVLEWLDKLKDPAVRDASRKLINVCLEIESLRDIATMMRNYGIVPPQNEVDVFGWLISNLRNYKWVFSRDESAAQVSPVLAGMSRDERRKVLSKYSDVELIALYPNEYDTMNRDKLDLLSNFLDRLEYLEEHHEESIEWKFSISSACYNVGSYEDGTIGQMASRLNDMEDIIVSYGGNESRCYTCWLLYSNITGSKFTIPYTFEEQQQHRLLRERGERVPPSEFSVKEANKLKILLKAIPPNRRPISAEKIVEKLKQSTSTYGRYIAKKKEQEIQHLENNDPVRALGSVDALLIALDDFILSSGRLPNLVLQLKQLKEKWASIRGWNNVVDNFFGWFAILGIWMRKWYGPGREYPYEWISDGVYETLSDLQRRIDNSSSGINVLTNQERDMYNRMVNKFRDSCDFLTRNTNNVREFSAFLSLSEARSRLYGEREVLDPVGPNLMDDFREPNANRTYLAWMLGIPGVNFDNPEVKERILEFGDLVRQIHVVEFHTRDYLGFADAVMEGGERNIHRKITNYMKRSSLKSGEGHCLAEASRYVGQTGLYFLYAVGDFDGEDFTSNDSRDRNHNYTTFLQQYQQAILDQIRRLYVHRQNERYLPESLKQIVVQQHNFPFDLETWTGRKGKGEGYATDVWNAVPAAENEQISEQELRYLRKDSKLRYLRYLSPSAKYWIRLPK